MRTAPSYTPEVGMRVRRLANQGPHSGQELVIERVIDQSGGYFGIVGTFEDGYFGTFDAERFEAIPDNIAPSLASPIQVSPTFTVGQEVIISERVTADQADNQADSDACSVARDYIGQRCVITLINEHSGLVCFSWNNGHNRWHLMPQYLDAADGTPLVADKSDFDAAWRLARSGDAIGSLMDALWDPIRAPINDLSNLKGTWSSLIITRAVLRLRRQVPNSYEEQVGKGHSWGTPLAARAWTAAVKD